MIIVLLMVLLVQSGWNILRNTWKNRRHYCKLHFLKFIKQNFDDWLLERNIFTSNEISFIILLQIIIPSFFFFYLQSYLLNFEITKILIRLYFLPICLCYCVCKCFLLQILNFSSILTMIDQSFSLFLQTLKIYRYFVLITYYLLMLHKWSGFDFRDLLIEWDHLKPSNRVLTENILKFPFPTLAW